MKQIFTIAVICCVLGGMASAQDMNLTGAGARAEGIGGAFIGVADDATAIVWNPAGLAQLERAEASVVGRFLTEKNEYTYTYYPTANTSLSQSHVAFNFGSFALPFKLGSTAVVIAAAYQRQLDFYSNVKATGGETEGKGGADTFTPGLSVRISPVFSIGASANIWNGTYDWSLSSTGYAGTSGASQTLKFKGFNMVFGGMVDLEGLAKPVPLKFGVTVRTPFDLTADGTQSYTGSGPSREVPYSSTIQMPLMIGFGTSLRLAENFMLAADYEIRSYGDRIVTYETVDSYGYPDKGTYPLSQSKQNLNQFRAGAEYLIVLKKIVIPIRVGYKNMPTLSANIDLNNLPADQVIGKAISMGSGYISNLFAIDVSYTMSDYTQTYAGQGDIKYTVGTVGASLIVYF